jgi:ELWxxDGT repeat protein
MKIISVFIFVFLTFNSTAQNLPSKAYQGYPTVGGGEYAVFNNKLIFNGVDSGSSLIWLRKFTGSGNPTFISGSPMGGGSGFTQIASTFYFTADEVIHGWEFYKWDGINAASLTTDLAPGSSSLSPQNPIAFNNKIYFVGKDTAGYELWEYDPTTNSGQRLTNINTAGQSLNSTNIQLIAFNNKIFFPAIPGPSSNNTSELYSYDPATGITSMVADIWPGNLGSGPMNFIVLGSKLYFTANDGTHGSELFSYDGINPPQMMVDLCPQGGADSNGISSFYAGMLAFNNKLYFWGKNNPASSDYDLWSFDPSNNNTNLVYPTQYPGKVGIVYHNKMYFSKRTSSNVNTAKTFLLSYDGINPPQYIDTSISIYFWPRPYWPITEFNNDLYFTGTTNPLPNNVLTLYRFNDSASIIEAINRIADVSLYPNPSTDKTTIGFSLKQQQNLSLAITDMNGRIVYSENKKQYQSGNSKIVVDMHSFATGNYICRLTDEHSALVWSGKVVKE